MNRLAGIYYMGQIVPQNDIIAVKWGLCASGLGSKTAEQNLARMKAHVDARSIALGAKAAESWAKTRLNKRPTKVFKETGALAVLFAQAQ